MSSFSDSWLNECGRRGRDPSSAVSWGYRIPVVQRWQTVGGTTSFGKGPEDHVRTGQLGEPSMSSGLSGGWNPTSRGAQPRGRRHTGQPTGPGPLQRSRSKRSANRNAIATPPQESGRDAKGDR
jgi:hypothetical protein